MSEQTISNIDLVHYWIGFVLPANLVPVRENRNKYNVSYDDFRGIRFPPCCSRFAHVISKEIAHKIVLSTSHIRKIASIDDVYIGLLANDSGIRTYNGNRSTYNGQILYYTIA